MPRNSAGISKSKAEGLAKAEANSEIPKKGHDLVNNIPAICTDLDNQFSFSSRFKREFEEKELFDLWEGIKKSAISIGEQRSELISFDVNTTNTNAFYFGRLAESFKGVLSDIKTRFLPETDVEKFRRDAESYKIKLRKILNKFPEASIDEHVLQSFSKSAEKHEKAKIFVKEVNSFWHNMDHFFRVWLSTEVSLKETLAKNQTSQKNTLRPK